MKDASLYSSPFTERYASHEMSHLFSTEYRSSTWRKLWISLAKAEKKLGLPIKDEQITSLEKHAPHFNWQRLAELEKQLKHDVMAHIHAFAEIAPEAKGILHLGATSCFVTDNSDLIAMREALLLIENKLATVVKTLAIFAEKYADLPCIAYTHLQPAQPTTVGKRACLWLQDLLTDLKEIQKRRKELPFLGVKGATGSQASFLSLFNGEEAKVTELDRLIASMFGFSNVLTIAGQTYTRKIDQLILDTLGGLAASAHKFATDLRLLSHLKEIDESVTDGQVGSSAMPHKQNPVHAERVCGLARFLISLKENPSYTLATQWLERSLDDSSNRRLVLPNAFLAADALCLLLFHIISHCHVHQRNILQHLEHERPLLILEPILMAATKRGGDRQALHAKLQKAAQRVKEGTPSVEFLATIAADPAFFLSKHELEEIYKNSLTPGLCEHQVRKFLKEDVFPFLKSLGEFHQPMPAVML
ncbi:MAG: adenylosuccinate lyase [Simkania sp.]|nr:adenylosuccinate lyase [Simkania sp.]